MVRPWVKISLCQYEKLKKIKERTGRPLYKIIREAVYGFVHKKKYPTNVIVSHVLEGTRDKYKSVSAYFVRSEWALLEGYGHIVLLTTDHSLPRTIIRSMIRNN